MSDASGKYYNLSVQDIALIKSVNADIRKYRCSCGIEENKPAFCRQGPLLTTIMPDCGFRFENNEDGEPVRIGSCLRCGCCCSLPRHNGDPFGFFDPGPSGKPCRFLIVEEETEGETMP